MSSIKHFMANFKEGQQGIKIKNEIGKKSNNDQFLNDDNISCVYNSQSPSSKTILITNNYSQNNKQNISTSSNLNKSSITIYTHNSDSEGSSNIPATPRSTVVLDRINILINNHFNDPDATADNMPVCITKQSEKYDTVPIKTELPDSTTALNQFVNGQDVLVRQKDDRFYLGKIVAVACNQCLVKFGDNTERWSSVNELTKLNCRNNSPICIVCKITSDPAPVAVCDKCLRGYHQKCRSGGFEINGILLCGRCTSHNDQIKLEKSTHKPDIKNSTQENSNSSNLKLPYDLNSLTWDKHHRENKDRRYCYCGKNGDWYMQMIQCARCRQWFHENCVKCLQYPLYCGDIFYLFVCCNCNHGHEFIRRLEMKMEDMVHLILFSLTIHHSRTYYDITNVIVPYALDNWHALQLPSKIKSLTFSQIKDQIIMCLNSHTTKFKSRELKNKTTEYGLKFREPPLALNIVLSSGPEISEKYIKDFCQKYPNVHILPKSTSSTCVTTDIRMRNLMTGVSYRKDISDNESIISENYDHNESDSDNEVLANFVNNSIKNVNNSSMSPNHHASTSHTISPNVFNGSSGNDFCLDSDRSRDLYDYVNKEETSNCSKKRSKPRSKDIFSNVKRNDLIDLCDSSDDTSSRSTLDLIIPPPKDFQGFNNPFLSPTKLKIENDQNQTVSIKQHNSSSTQPLSIFGKVNIPASGQIRMVRTVKRRLSARDIVIGPNMEVKRRKLRRRSGPVEVISTATIHTSKYPSYMPIRTDSKDFSFPVMRSSINSASSSTSSTPVASCSNSPLATTPTTNIPITNVFTGRRLRKRGAKNYAENPRRNSTSNSILNGSSTSNVGSLNLSGSPVKNSNGNEVSLTDLQSSLTMYFGAANRIENGEKFVIKGKRICSDGRYQYLIDWEGVS